MARSIILIGLLVISGCATLQSAAKGGIQAAAEGVAAADRALSSEYADAAKRALEEANTIIEYESSMKAWNLAVQYLAFARAALLEAEQALDTWERTDNAETFYDAASCLLAALQQLNEMFESLSLRSPALLREAIEYSRKLPLGVCRG